MRAVQATALAGAVLVPARSVRSAGPGPVTPAGRTGCSRQAQRSSSSRSGARSVAGPEYSSSRRQTRVTTGTTVGVAPRRQGVDHDVARPLVLGRRDDALAARGRRTLIQTLG